MTNRKKHFTIMLSFLIVLGVLSGACLLKQPTAVSDSERRPLAQMPEFSVETLMSGKFFADFETYTTDQFPLRDVFRRLKAWAQTKILGRQDNNGYYEVDGYLSKLDSTLNKDSIAHATERMKYLYDTYFAKGDHNIAYGIVPDKNYFLAAQNGYPAMDYDALRAMMKAELGGVMQEIDLFSVLTIADYYRTDTHWRQERLENAVQAIAGTLGITDRLSGQYTEKALSPFYGVYSGQSALPCAPETLYYLTNDTLENCIVTQIETGKTAPVYDLPRFEGADPYELFLSGSQAILTIQNPANTSGERLVVFRDSFGSAVVPLLVEAYSEVIVVDIRYVNSAFLGRFIEFTGEEDVLFLYSTLVLNSSAALK
ncbi:MAG: hypothetical protein IJY28_02445 [Clostridia bacterium]|nr:hypothetical protein [Clostridia bacterium]